MLLIIDPVVLQYYFALRLMALKGSIPANLWLTLPLLPSTSAAVSYCRVQSGVTAFCRETSLAWQCPSSMLPLGVCVF